MHYYIADLAHDPVGHLPLRSTPSLLCFWRVSSRRVIRSADAMEVIDLKEKTFRLEQGVRKLKQLVLPLLFL